MVTHKHAGRTAALTVLLAFSASLTACTGDDSSSTGLPVTGIEDATFNNQSETVTGSCFVNQTTAFGQLRLVYQGGTKSDPLVVYWNAPKQNQTTYLNVNVSGVTQFAPFVNAAINVWSNQLNSSPALPTGKYFSLLPQAVNTGGRVSTAEGTQDSTNPETLGVTGFAVTQFGTYINNAGMTFFTQAVDGNGNANNSLDARYSAALHELGHAMGLAHNSQRGSVMFPDTDVNTNAFGACFHYNYATPNSSTPARYPYDTDQLEYKYDPAFVDPSGSDGNPKCGRNTCFSALQHVIPPSGIADTRYPVAGTTQVAQISSPVRPLSAVGSSSAAARAAFVGGAKKSQWLLVNDFPGALESSAEDLVLSSSLVAQVSVGPRVMSVPNGVGQLVVHKARISQMFRHLLGPDEGRRVGDQIAVVDLTPPEGGTYIDDPELSAGAFPVVFLKHASAQLSRQLGVRDLYAFTTHYSSKWRVDKGGKLHVLSVRRSRVSTDIDGRDAKDLFARVRTKYGSAAYKEESALRAMLSARGISTGSDVARYRATLSTASHRLVREFSRKDALPTRMTLDYLMFRD